MNLFQLTHLAIPASDGVLLPSLHYTGRKTTTLLVYIHGAGGSSIIRRPELSNFLAEQLTKESVDLLMFANRGSGYITKFDTTQGAAHVGGMTYERIDDFLYDLTGIMEWAQGQGYTHIHLAGHSTGANKLVNILATHHFSSVESVILVGGGDDVGLQRARYTKDQLAIVEAQLAAIPEDQKDTLVPTDLFPGGHPISWGSLGELITPLSNYDIFPFERNQQPRPDYFRQLRKLLMPVLFIYGSEDFGTIIPVHQAVAMLRSIVPHIKSQIIIGADHNFNNDVTPYVTAITDWVGNRYE